MDWRAILGLDAPQASSTARPVGQDELGNWVYADSTGSRYSVGTQPAAITDAQRNDAVLMRLGLLPPDPRTPNPRAAVNALAGMVTSGFTAPANALRGEMVTYGDALDTAGVTALGANAMPAPANSLRAFNVYHGSPHDFDKFSMSKIGTGEGAQAYGHGLYFADNKEVAEMYRRKLAFPAGGGDDILAQVADDVNYYNGNVDAARAAYEGGLKSSNPDAVARARAKLDALPAAEAKYKGRMYEVQIDANPEDFLDWDKPLSEQPAKVREALASVDVRAGNMSAKDRAETIEAALSGDPRLAHLLRDRTINSTADTVYKGMADTLGGTDWPIGADAATRSDFRAQGAAKATAALRDAGIPGIRYLDAGSRSAGDGSRNYVVFDENLLSIVRKYGWAAAAPLLAPYGLTPEQAQAQYEGQM